MITSAQLPTDLATILVVELDRYEGNYELISSSQRIIFKSGEKYSIFGRTSNKLPSMIL